MDPLKIMIVDDDLTTLEVLSAILEEEGHTVTKRDTPLGTTHAILQEKPDVVLLDLRMPGLSGDRLAGLIATRRADPPILILHSSSPRVELEALAKRCGASGAIEKTADPAEFRRRFEAIVTRVRAAGWRNRKGNEQ